MAVAGGTVTPPRKVTTLEFSFSSCPMRRWRRADSRDLSGSLHGPSIQLTLTGSPVAGSGRLSPTARILSSHCSCVDPRLHLRDHMSLALSRNCGDRLSWPLPPPSVSSHKPGAQGWVGNRWPLVFSCVTQGTPYTQRESRHRQGRQAYGVF